MLSPPFATLTRSPFDDVRQLETAFDRLLGAAGPAASKVWPPVNLWADEQRIVASIDLPGVSRDAIDVSVEGDTLSIRGERPARDDNGTVLLAERPTGRFARTIRLPTRVDPDNVEARYQGGVLVVEMQRPQSDQPRRIAIRTA